MQTRLLNGRYWPYLPPVAAGKPADLLGNARARDELLLQQPDRGARHAPRRHLSARCRATTAATPRSAISSSKLRLTLRFNNGSTKAVYGAAPSRWTPFARFTGASASICRKTCSGSKTRTHTSVCKLFRASCARLMSGLAIISPSARLPFRAFSHDSRRCTAGSASPRRSLALPPRITGSRGYTRSSTATDALRG